MYVWLLWIVAPDIFAMWLSFGCLPQLWFISINCPFDEFSSIKLFDVLFAAMNLTEGTKSLKYNMEVLDLLDFPVCNLHCIRRQKMKSSTVLSSEDSLCASVFSVSNGRHDVICTSISKTCYGSWSTGTCWHMDFLAFLGTTVTRYYTLRNWS